MWGSCKGFLVSIGVLLIASGFRVQAGSAPPATDSGLGLDKALDDDAVPTIFDACIIDDILGNSDLTDTLGDFIGKVIDALSQFLQ